MLAEMSKVVVLEAINEKAAFESSIRYTSTKTVILCAWRSKFLARYRPQMGDIFGFIKKYTKWMNEWEKVETISYSIPVE